MSILHINRVTAANKCFTFNYPIVFGDGDVNSETQFYSMDLDDTNSYILVGGATNSTVLTSSTTMPILAMFTSLTGSLKWS